MNFFHSSGSPFVVLWYFYLIFFGTVLLANFIFGGVGRIISWRTRRYTRRYAAKAAKK